MTNLEIIEGRDKKKKETNFKDKFNRTKNVFF